MRESYQAILDYIVGLEIVDTHEHLTGLEANRNRETDVLQEYLTHYFNSDLRSAGLSAAALRQVMDHTQPLLARWEIVEPYWEMARHTGYGRSLDLTVQALYGLDGIRRDTLLALNEAFLQTLATPGHYRRVLKDASRIAISLLDAEGPYDPAFFRPVVRLDRFIWPRNLQTVLWVEEEYGARIHSLDDWLAACEATLLRAREQGAVAIKNSDAYVRSLRFEPTPLREAERGIEAMRAVRHMPDWEEKPINVDVAFQDAMFHYILGLAEKHAMPVQIHTGIQEGSGNLLTNSDPQLLNPVFVQYPGINFDIFHIGYPYQHTLSALAKMFPNVYIDMCWAHIISPTASVNALAEWIDSVPVNKISAFGGDYGFVDAVYGHQWLARRNVAQALARKVEEGVFDVARACEIARLLFIENPARLFGLEGLA
jgi:predicted TIM-barrel fold metal-dependent hydrolase